MADIVNDKACEIALEMQRQQGLPADISQFDPFLIIAIAGLIVSVIGVIIEKRKSEASALEMMKNPSIMQRWTFRQMAHKRLGNKYKHLYPYISKSMYKVAQGLTEHDVQLMYRRQINA